MDSIMLPSLLEPLFFQAQSSSFWDATSQINGIQAIVDGIQIGMGTVWGKIKNGLLVILSVCVAFKMVLLWMENLASSDLLGLVMKWIHTLVVGAILVASITNMSDIGAYVWDGTGKIMAAFSPDPDAGVSGRGGAGGAVDAIWEGVKGNALALWELLTEEGRKGGSWWENWITNLADNVTAGLIMIVSMILMGVFVGLVLFQLIAGIFRLISGLLFLPVGLAFWPLIDDWGQKSISIVVSGMIQMGIISFMVGLLSAITRGLINAYSSGALDSGLLFNSSLMGGKTMATLMLTGMVVVMAIGCQTAISAATGIFSGLSFAVRGVSTGSGGGGGGGASSSGSQGSSGGASSPVGGGGGGAGGGASLGTAAAVAATVATGGAAAPAAAGAGAGGAGAAASGGGAAIGGGAGGGGAGGGSSSGSEGASTGSGSSSAGEGSSGGAEGASSAEGSDSGSGASVSNSSSGSEGASTGSTSSSAGEGSSNSSSGNQGNQWSELKNAAKAVVDGGAKITKYMNKQVNNS